MKHILLLDNKSLHYYDFESLYKQHSISIYAIVTKDYYDKIPYETKKNLKKIFVLPFHNLDTPIKFSFKDVKNIIEKNFAKELKNRTLYISCADEMNINTASLIREKFNIYGTKPSLSKKFTNKFLQKEYLTKNLIPIPSYQLIIPSHFDTHLSIKNKINFPCIIKPIDMTGSIGVSLLKNCSDFKAYLATHAIHFQELLLEEFIEGKLYHVDLITQKESILFSQACEYFYNGLSFVMGSIHGSIPLKESDELNKKLINFAKNINKFLGLENGCTHHEIFVNKNNEFIFLEAGLRPPGSYVPMIYKESFDINIMNCNLLIDSNEKVVINKKHTENAFWSIFPLQQSGKIENFSIKLNSSYHLEKTIKKSKKIKSDSLIDRSASLIAKSKNYDLLYKDFMLLKKNFVK